MRQLVFLALIFFSSSLLADSQMFRAFEKGHPHYKERNDYREHRVSGYNIQPSLPNWWRGGCKKVGFRCMDGVDYQGLYHLEVIKEPSILREHR